MGFKPAPISVKNIICLAQNPQMLQQNLNTKQNQNNTANHLRLALKLAAKNIADFYAGGAEAKGKCADKQDGSKDVDIAGHRERNSGGKRVNRCGNRH